LHIKYIYWLLPVLIFVAVPSQLWADQPAVLDSLINQAVANNPDLQTAEYHLRAARSMAGAALPATHTSMGTGGIGEMWASFRCHRPS